MEIAFQPYFIFFFFSFHSLLFSRSFFHLASLFSNYCLFLFFLNSIYHPSSSFSFSFFPFPAVFFFYYYQLLVVRRLQTCAFHTREFYLQRNEMKLPDCVSYCVYTFIVIVCFPLDTTKSIKINLNKNTLLKIKIKSKFTKITHCFSFSYKQRV